MSSEELKAEREIQHNMTHCWDCDKPLRTTLELERNRCAPCWYKLEEDPDDTVLEEEDDGKIPYWERI
jgi:hypothetical protein